MKKIILVFIFLIIIFLIKNIYSQTTVEQNSGVTVNLTSVCKGLSYPQGVYICGNNGTVLKTTNDGNNWFNISGNGIPSNVNLVNISCIDMNTALTAGNIGTTTYVYRTSNGGANWTQIFSQMNGKINALWMKTILLGFMCGDPVGSRWSLWKTTNGGFNWDSTGLFLPQNGSENGWNNSLCIVGNRIWFGTNNSRVYFSSNFGLNWQNLSTLEVNSYSVSFYYGDSTFGYFGGTNSYRSTNSGLNWNILNCSGTGDFKGFTFGATLGPFLDFTIRSDSSIYQNDGHNGTTNWNRVYSAPSGVYRHIAMSYSTNLVYSWAVRSNGGISRLWLVYAGIKKISSDVPKSYSLYQNYPNPFNPSTKIKFSIPEVRSQMSEVRLEIYDILGREVATLVNKKLNPGTYEVEWDGSNYASGVYFYKLIITDPETSSALYFTETKKLILLR